MGSRETLTQPNSYECDYYYYYYYYYYSVMRKAPESEAYLVICELFFYGYIHDFTSLILYAPCIILQYVYKPTRCTKFL